VPDSCFLVAAFGISRTSNLLRAIETLFGVSIAQRRYYTFMASRKLPWEALWRVLWRGTPNKYPGRRAPVVGAGRFDQSQDRLCQLHYGDCPDSAYWRRRMLRDSDLAVLGRDRSSENSAGTRAGSSPTAAVDEDLLGAATGFALRRATPHIAAVRLHVPRRAVVGLVNLQDLVQLRTDAGV